jgi:hypothetical protein
VSVVPVVVFCNKEPPLAASYQEKVPEVRDNACSAAVLPGQIDTSVVVNSVLPTIDARTTERGAVTQEPLSKST